MHLYNKTHFHFVFMVPVNKLLDFILNPMFHLVTFLIHMNFLLQFQKNSDKTPIFSKNNHSIITTFV